MTRDDVSAAEYSVKNDLYGVDLATPRTTLTNNDAQTLFMLSNKNDHFGFHKFGGAKVPARKAFFTVSSSEKARSFSMVFDDETTSLREKGIVKSEEFLAAAEWYTLDGRKLQGKPTQKGLYIVNGKKVLVH